MRPLELSEGTLTVAETSAVEDGVGVSRRSYDLPGGDRVVMGRAELTGGEAVVDRLLLPSGYGTIRYFADNGSWIETTLEDGTFRAATVEIVVGGQALFCYLPRTYQTAPRSSLIEQPEWNGALIVSETADGWEITLTGRAPEGDFVCDYTWVRSAEPLLDCFRDTDDWYNYTQDGAGKWCYDGYYRTTPDTYDPSGERYLYRCPAAYVFGSVAERMEERTSARALATAMADTMVLCQNRAGYWETGPESQWLQNDYGIGPGFYDTRFNSDLAEVLCAVYQQTGGDFLRQALERYGDFYLDFAAAHHRETAGGGWLVEDYGVDAQQPVHTSLNHQLAECLILYRMADALGRSDLAQLADRLLQAVEDTGEAWIADDGNLYYSIDPAGVCSGTDYPYLTYNDLLALNGYLRERTGADNGTLVRLMESKRAWMDRNGVTGYDRAPADWSMGGEGV